MYLSDLWSGEPDEVVGAFAWMRQHTGAERGDVWRKLN